MIDLMMIGLNKMAEAGKSQFYRQKASSKVIRILKFTHVLWNATCVMWKCASWEIYLNRTLRLLSNWRKCFGLLFKRGVLEWSGRLVFLTGVGYTFLCIDFIKKPMRLARNRGRTKYSSVGGGAQGWFPIDCIDTIGGRAGWWAEGDGWGMQKRAKGWKKGRAERGMAERGWAVWGRGGWPGKRGRFGFPRRRAWRGWGAVWKPLAAGEAAGFFAVDVRIVDLRLIGIGPVGERIADPANPRPTPNPPCATRSTLMYYLSIHYCFPPTSPPSHTHPLITPPLQVDTRPMAIPPIVGTSLLLDYI